ncbi:hypothetical protein EI94DRAFT_1710660 [Lactarius quietus]|nr:hypothetical protein EI94DRAFT_1710660 [Lactarius quietus]
MLCTFPPPSPSEDHEATPSYCLYGVAVGSQWAGPAAPCGQPLILTVPLRGSQSRLGATAVVWLGKRNAGQGMSDEPAHRELLVRLSPKPGYHLKTGGCRAMLCTFPPPSPSEDHEATPSYHLYRVAVGISVGRSCCPLWATVNTRHLRAVNPDLAPLWLSGWGRGMQGRAGVMSLSVNTWPWSHIHMGRKLARNHLLESSGKASLSAQKADGMWCQVLSALWVIGGGSFEPHTTSRSTLEH